MKKLSKLQPWQKILAECLYCRHCHSCCTCPAHLQVRMVTGCLAVLAAQAPFRAFLLSVVLLLAEADQAFTCRTLGEQEWA